MSGKFCRDELNEKVRKKMGLPHLTFRRCFCTRESSWAVQANFRRLWRYSVRTWFARHKTRARTVNTVAKNFRAEGHFNGCTATASNNLTSLYWTALGLLWKILEKPSRTSFACCRCFVRGIFPRRAWYAGHRSIVACVSSG